MNRVVTITDKNGRFFRIKITTIKDIPLIKRIPGGLDPRIFKETLQKRGWMGGSVTGEWKTLDEGYIKVRSGKTRTRFSDNGDLTTSDLLILGDQGIKTYDGNYFFGIQLFEYEHSLGGNSKGEGVVIQPWVVAFEPGRISWQAYRR